MLQAMPPLTLAETASIFGEMIVFRDLLERAPSKEDRLSMLIAKVTNAPCQLYTCIWLEGSFFYI